MITEAINRILELSKIEVVDIGGHEYSKHGLERIRPPEETDPHSIAFETLTGITDYAALLTIDPGTFVIVNDPYSVTIFSEMKTPDNRRACLATSSVRNHGYRFGEWNPLEEFIVSLQCMFLPTEQSESLMSHLGNLANENITENKDDGFSQTIQVRSGITTKSAVTIENPLTLVPYRTFPEVEQPEAICIFRIKKERDKIFCALFTADGGAWGLKAMDNIKEWLKEAVPGIPVVA